MCARARARVCACVCVRVCARVRACECARTGVCVRVRLQRRICLAFADAALGGIGELKLCQNLASAWLSLGFVQLSGYPLQLIANPLEHRRVVGIVQAAYIMTHEPWQRSVLCVDERA